MPSGDAGTTQPNAPQSIGRARELSLRLVFPRELEGVRIELARGLELGREAPETLAEGRRFAAVPHATVSRRHVLVHHGLGVPIIEDLGSSNGTYVDGTHVTKPTPVAAHSVVRLGDVLGIVEEGLVEMDAPGTLAPPGVAPSMARARVALARAARESAAVLVTGETGTGKETVAAEVHRLSGRGGAYLALNCAELSPELVESQLFGHMKGAFTGAASAHDGLFVAAHGGTLFLDEIGELPLALQAKLLRVLQEGDVRPVGSVQTRRVDVRVVSATNQDLGARVESGVFRRDLYARLSTFELCLPPLRERKQDLFFWTRTLAARRSGNPALSLDFRPSAAEAILLHGWPENLRGLDRLVHRLLAAEEPPPVGLQALDRAMPELFAGDRARLAATEPGDIRKPSQSDPPAAKNATERPLPDAPTREEFLAAYEALGRSVRAISKHYGRDRKQVYRWLKTFGVER
jgi:DNA-binding NtrC family response regulator